MKNPTSPLVTAVLLITILQGCMIENEHTAPQPPESEGEGMVILAANAAVKARLSAHPATIRSGETCKLTVINHGEVPLWYGRPVTVESWDGQSWVETSDSRESFWTMDLLAASPGEAGPVQEWPFGNESPPVSGWYRFTKQVGVADDSGNPAMLVLRARVFLNE